MYVNLNVLLQIVSVEVQDQIMNIVKPIAHNDEWQLVCQLGFLNKRKLNVEDSSLREKTKTKKLEIKGNKK